MAQTIGDDRDQRQRVVVHGDHDGRDDHRPLEMRVVLQHSRRRGQAEGHLPIDVSENVGQRESVVEAEPR